MHRVVVIPFAAPDKSVPFKYLHDRMGYPISIGYFTVSIGFGPTPVVRVIAVNVDSDAERVSAKLVGSGNRSPVICAGGGGDVLFLFFRQLIQFGRHRR